MLFCIIYVHIFITNRILKNEIESLGIQISIAHVIDAHHGQGQYLTDVRTRRSEQDKSF
jgi:hypothetical protein